MCSTTLQWTLIILMIYHYWIICAPTIFGKTILSTLMPLNSSTNLTLVQMMHIKVQHRDLSRISRIRMRNICTRIKGGWLFHLGCNRIRWRIWVIFLMRQSWKSWMEGTMEQLLSIRETFLLISALDHFRYGPSSSSYPHLYSKSSSNNPRLTN